MTPIQKQSLPTILSGDDIIGQAQTGSGKTVAFGLGVLNKLEHQTLQIQALILCPTRELANQVTCEIRQLARMIKNIKIITLCGGMPFKAQKKSLEYGNHIIVGTPGRIADHLRRGSLALPYLQTFVLDEADRMLDMGFQEEVSEIITYLPAQRQNLLFSATFPDKIEHMSQHMMSKPLRVNIETTTIPKNIQQHFYQVLDHQRSHALHLLLLQHQPKTTLVFCHTKIECDDVADELTYLGFSALPLHGDLEQHTRDQTLIQFSNKSISILVATDIAARGLDVEQLDMVINYRIAYDLDTHVHRIGRTGRAGQQGTACTLYEKKERDRLTQLAKHLQINMKDSSLPANAEKKQNAFSPSMVTLQIRAGKKQKVRAGDILGALTKEGDILGNHVGKIHVLAQWSYVAIHSSIASIAFRKLQKGLLKGRTYRVRIMSHSHLK